MCNERTSIFTIYFVLFCFCFVFCQLHSTKSYTFLYQQTAEPFFTSNIYNRFLFWNILKGISKKWIFANIRRKQRVYGMEYMDAEVVVLCGANCLRDYDEL